MRIGICADDNCEQSDKIRRQIENQYPDCEVNIEYCPEMYGTHMVMCSHIFELSEDDPEDIYIDPWCNIIYSAEDYVYCKNFEQTKELFLLCKKEILLKFF